METEDSQVEATTHPETSTSANRKLSRNLGSGEE